MWLLVLFLVAGVTAVTALVLLFALDQRSRLQQGVAFGWAQAQVGRDHPVVIDGPDPEFASHFRGRTYADSPDIDCAVRVKGKGLRPGDFVKVKVTAADGYDLAGRAVGKPW